jgi:hypothetical protein
MEALTFRSSIETIKEINNSFLPNPKFKLKEKDLFSHYAGSSQLPS